MLLNESDFEEIEQEIPEVETEVVTDSEILPEGPKQGEATGISNIIHDLLIDINETIQNYNNAAANMESYPELQKLMHDIAGEEFIHIGELEKALEVLSPNAANIEEGEVEAEDSLESNSSIDESLNEDFNQQDINTVCPNCGSKNINIIDVNTEANPAHKGEEEAIINYHCGCNKCGCEYIDSIKQLFSTKIIKYSIKDEEAYKFIENNLNGLGIWNFFGLPESFEQFLEVDEDNGGNLKNMPIVKQKEAYLNTYDKILSLSNTEFENAYKNLKNVKGYEKYNIDKSSIRKYLKRIWDESADYNINSIDHGPCTRNEIKSLYTKYEFDKSLNEDTEKKSNGK